MFNWYSFIPFALVSIFTPGPNTMTAMSNGSKKGVIRALPFNFGVMCGFFVVMMLCATFCSLLSAFIPKIKTPMLIVGACYLLYLAYKMLRGGALAERDAVTGFGAAIALQFINAKLFLFGVMVMQIYILPAFEGQYLILAGFSLLLCTTAFVATLCWSAFGATFQRLFAKHGKVLNVILALMLVYCAVSLFL